MLPKLAAVLKGLPDHAVIDRLIRGRAWIPVLGLMLVGIVAMQVEVLKLGATMGRAIENGSALQSRNELLRDSVASLQDEQRIVRLAGGMGMVMPAPGGVGFLRPSGGTASKAAANIKAPDATAFSALLTSNGSITQTPTAPSPASTLGATSAASTSAAPTSTTPAATTPTATTPATAAPTVTTPTASPTAPSTSSATSPTSGAVTSGTPVAPTSTTPATSSGGAAVTGG